MQRGKLRRDLEAQLRARLPAARIEAAGAGRLVVATEEDARPVLASLYGVASSSPCRRCTVVELSDVMLAFATAQLAGARSFAVRGRQQIRC